MPILISSIVLFAKHKIYIGILLETIPFHHHDRYEVRLLNNGNQVWHMNRRYLRFESATLSTKHIQDTYFAVIKCNIQLLATLRVIDLNTFESELSGSSGYYIFTTVTWNIIYIDNGKPFFCLKTPKTAENTKACRKTLVFFQKPE